MAERPLPHARAARWLHAGWPVITVLYLALFLPIFRPQVSIIDPVGYYSWARSILIDRDLDTSNEYAHYGMAHIGPRTPTGYMHNQWASGSALLWLPAMGLAHGGVSLARALGATLPADGYSWPYVWAAALTSTLFGLGALLLAHRLALHLFGAGPALLATLTIWLATPFVYYQYQQPLMSHANTAFLSALLLYLWWRAHRHGRPPVEQFALGLIVGLAVWVRTEDLILLGLLGLELGIDWVREARERGPLPALRAAFARGLPILAGFALIFLPLIIFRRVVYGGWVLNTYAGSGGGTVSAPGVRVLRILFSSNRGLFVCAPITLPAICGLAAAWRTQRRLALFLAGWLLIVWAMLSIWSGWSGGDAFGPRHWVRFTPAFILGLAALIQRILARRPRALPAISLAAGLVIAWNLALMAQYALGFVAPSGRVDLLEMVRNQWRVIPAAAEQLAGRLTGLARR